MKHNFRPEFLNRIDESIVFKTLSHIDLEQIVKLQLADLQTRLNEQELTLRVSSTARKLLINHGYNQEQGARPMRRAIQDLIEDRLAHGVLDGEYKPGDTVSVTAKDGKLVFGVKDGAKAKV